ncbi:MAG TPA: hypothetical protein VK356_14230, partial [Thermomicrobiales bacterium]|nr:hypothetical protein [Thermomicrobiales bacterium]
GPRGSDYTSFGRLHDFMKTGATIAQGNAEWDRRMTTICGRMKTNGIIIYTITFGASLNSSTQNIYSGCATKPEESFRLA